MSKTGLTKPSLSDIQSRVLADINSALPEADAKLRYTVLNRLAGAVVGISHELHGMIDKAADDTNLLYARNEVLDIWGSIWSVARKPQTTASGLLSVSISTPVFIPAGTVFIRGDGYQYKTTTDNNLTLPVTDIEITSVLPGVDTNAGFGVVLNTLVPIAGILANSVVNIDGLVGGSDLEGDDSYRTRILTRIAQPPHGGNASDYVNWALSQPGVTRAWAYTTSPTSALQEIRFCIDDSHHIDGIPTSGEVLSVQSYIDSVKPLNSTVAVLAPIPLPVDVQISNLHPDNTLLRENIKIELADLFINRADMNQPIRRSWIWDTISNTTGVDYFTLDMPSGDVFTSTPGELPTMGQFYVDLILV